MSWRSTAWPISGSSRVRTGGIRVARLVATWREPIPQLIFGLTWLLILTRFIWPLALPLPVKIVVAVLVLVALQFHRWSRLSSGSEFSPEFPRPVVALFNWALGTIVLLMLLQLLLDAGLLFAALIHGGFVGAPDGIRYGMAVLAAVAAAIGVQQAMRIPPLKDIEVGIRGLPRQFDGYTILQLTDLHISRLFPASWARAVVERSNKLGVDLIAITGDLIDGTLDARRADIEPLRDLRATDGVLRDLRQSRIHLRLRYAGWRTSPRWDCSRSRTGTSFSIATAAGWFSPGLPTGRRAAGGIPSETLPRCSKARPQVLPSSCSITSRARRERPRSQAWRCNCPDIRMAG